MPDETILCWRTGATVRDVRRLLTANDTAATSAFLWNRFQERYFVPFKALTITERNGFMIMAVCCLVIEEAFHQGWESSKDKSQLAFCSFFDRESEFHVFKGYAQQFYKHVRCGILHQAETTGGWTITLMPGAMLFDPQSKRVQADEFQAAVERALKGYTDAINAATGGDEIWKKCKAKLSAIIKNCD
jgi:hypothetical protein